MTNKRINEILLMLGDADFVWLGTQRTIYDRNNIDGEYEPSEVEYDDVGSLDIEELKYILRLFTLYNPEK